MMKARTAFFLSFVLTWLNVSAQPQWRFHLAFEDGTGARDTIWFVYDTTATLGWEGDPQVDTALGEGRVAMNLDEFNVFVYNWDLDSTKSLAFPYTLFPTHSADIQALNFEFPIILRWDTALFHANYLPDPAAINNAQMVCDHFFFVNNDELLQAYNMLLDDSVVVELEFQNDALFPLGVFFEHSSTIIENHSGSQNGIPVYPSPTARYIQWEPQLGICEIRVTDEAGRVVVEHRLGAGAVELDVSTLRTGLYFLDFTTIEKHRYHARFIKQD